MDQYVPGSPLANDHFFLPCPPRLASRQLPGSIPGDPNLFPARRERHLGAPGRAPRLREGKGSRFAPPQPGGAGETSPARLLSLTRGSSGLSGARGRAGCQAAEFADSKARQRRRRALRSAHERSPALPAHVADPRPRSAPAARPRASADPAAAGTLPSPSTAPGRPLRPALLPARGIGGRPWVR